MSKKWIILGVMVGLTIIGAVACGKSENTTSTKDNEKVSQTASEEDAVITSEQKKVLNDLSDEIDKLAEEVTNLEDVQDADLVYEK